MKGTITPIDLNELRFSEKKRAEFCKALYNNKVLSQSIVGHVQTNGGSKDDGMEIFQDSIVSLVKRIMVDQEFTITKDVEAYLFGIAKNLFYSKLNKQSKWLELNENHDNIIDESNPYLDLLGKEKSNLYHELLQLSSESCRQVLILWSYGYRMGEIAEKIGYKSEMMARKKKHECIQKLIALLKDKSHLVGQILENE